MIAEEIKALDKKKVLVTTDGGQRFALYKSEAKRFNIVEGGYIDQTDFSEILGILKKRCKNRALYILGRSDKTEHELKIKLKSSYYPEYIVDEVTEFLKNYDYINDYRYASNYIRAKKNSKSIRQIGHDLAAKGISRDIISDIMQNREADSREVIERILKQRKFDLDSHSEKECSRQIRYLMGKGFLYEEIAAVIKEYG